MTTKKSTQVQIDKDLFFAIRDHYRYLLERNLLTDADRRVMLRIEQKDDAIYRHDHYLDDRARMANLMNDFILTRQGKR